MARFLSTKAHGTIDYLSAVVLVAGPRALGWDRRLVAALDGLAAATIAYSLLTDYELGALPVVPMPAHLALDGMNALATLALPRLLGVRDPQARACLAAVAAFEAVVTLSTQTTPKAGWRATASPNGASRE